MQLLAFKHLSSDTDILATYGNKFFRTEKSGIVLEISVYGVPSKERIPIGDPARLVSALDFSIPKDLHVVLDVPYRKETMALKQPLSSSRMIQTGCEAIVATVTFTPERYVCYARVGNHSRIRLSAELGSIGKLG